MKINRKILVILLGVTSLFVSGCVSQGDYDKLLMEKNNVQAKYDKLSVDYDVIKDDIELLEKENRIINDELENAQRRITELETENNNLSEKINEFYHYSADNVENKDAIENDGSTSLIDSGITNYSVEVAPQESKHSQAEIDAKKEEIKEDVEDIKNIVNSHIDNIKDFLKGKR